MADPRTGRTAGKALHPKRGEIWLVALDPSVGHEIKKTRPAVIIQNDTANEYLSTTIVAPITSKLRFPLSPVHILIAAADVSGFEVASMALCDQIRTVDKRRLLKRLGAIDLQTIAQADDAIKVSLGLNGM